MTNNHNPSLLATAELICLRISCTLSNDDNKLFKDDPCGFIYSTYGIDVDGEINMQVVENNHNTIHLPLPYYQSLEPSRPSMPQPINDNNLEAVSGSEILMAYTDHVTPAGLREYENIRHGNQSQPIPKLSRPTTTPQPISASKITAK